jgi:uncharacterized protein (AIM24 family)
MQYVEIELDPQEIVIADPEALWWWIRSKWKRGDGSEQKSGIFGQLLNAGKGYLQAKVYSWPPLSIKTM